MNNYIMLHAFSDIKSLHVTYYGWHDLPQGLWIINEYSKNTYSCSRIDRALRLRGKTGTGHQVWFQISVCSYRSSYIHFIELYTIGVLIRKKVLGFHISCCKHLSVRWSMISVACSQPEFVAKFRDLISGCEQAMISVANGRMGKPETRVLFCRLLPETTEYFHRMHNNGSFY